MPNTTNSKQWGSHCWGYSPGTLSFSLCNSFEDEAPVDEIYGYLIFKWVLNGSGIVTLVMAANVMTSLILFHVIDYYIYQWYEHMITEFQVSYRKRLKFWLKAA